MKTSPISLLFGLANKLDLVILKFLDKPFFENNRHGRFIKVFMQVVPVGVILTIALLVSAVVYPFDMLGKNNDDTQPACA